MAAEAGQSTKLLDGHKRERKERLELGQRTRDGVVGWEKNEGELFMFAMRQRTRGAQSG